MVVAPGLKSLVWTSYSTGAERHTGENLHAALVTVIIEIEVETPATVAGVLTDNAENQVKSWKLLKLNRPIFGGGCAAHTLNLLMNDVLEDTYITSIVSRAMLIIRFVRNHHAMQHFFKDLLSEQDETSLTSYCQFHA